MLRKKWGRRGRISGTPKISRYNALPPPSLFFALDTQVATTTNTNLGWEKKPCWIQLYYFPLDIWKKDRSQNSSDMYIIRCNKLILYLFKYTFFRVVFDTKKSWSTMLRGTVCHVTLPSPPSLLGEEKKIEWNCVSRYFPFVCIFISAFSIFFEK